MNQTLIEYGIQTEKSDIRIHVCPTVRRVYVYETKEAVGQIGRKRYRTGQAYTGSIVTGVGYLVPPSEIPKCLSLTAPGNWWVVFKKNMTTTEKGNLAVRMVKTMLKKKMIPMPLSVAEITDEDLQIDGIDIIVKTSIRIQVKCDFDGGDKQLGGTGNLFLQIQECNPYSQV
jgi:hypothetical protein